jgi:hypothetical protein
MNGSHPVTPKSIAIVKHVDQLQGKLRQLSNTNGPFPLQRETQIIIV